MKHFTDVPIVLLRFLVRCYCREVSTDGRNVHVIYIDYGNTEWLKRERTVKLDDVFFKVRPQGVLVKLSGTKLTLSTDIQGV